MNLNDEIKELMDIDPLKIASDTTGLSYKNDHSTSMLGLSIQMKKSLKMSKLMDETNDVKFGCSLKEYISKITTFGFEKVLKIPFTNEENVIEHLYIFFEPLRSIMLIFDTFSSDRVNGGNMYYNIAIDNSKIRYNATSTGGFISHTLPDQRNTLICVDENFNQVIPEIPKQIYDYETENLKYRQRDKEIDDIIYSYLNVWSGNHDCREALIYNISEIEKMGSFIPKWLEYDMVYPMHYMDWKGENRGENFVDKIREERFSMLPEWVQIQIGFKKL